MSVILTIKIDTRKLRIYVTGDNGSISQYLESKNYAAIHKTLEAEKSRIDQAKVALDTLKKQAATLGETIQALSALRLAENGPEVRTMVRDLANDFTARISDNAAEQENLANTATKSVTGYTVQSYNFIYHVHKSWTMVEFAFPVYKHFGDLTLSRALAKLLEPLDLPVSLAPTVKDLLIQNLRDREYVTIFPETDTDLGRALQVIHRFESLALDIVREDTPSCVASISSHVNLSFEQIARAKYVTQKRFFASAPAASSGAAPAAYALPTTGQ